MTNATTIAGALIPDLYLQQADTKCQNHVLWLNGKCEPKIH